MRRIALLAVAGSFFLPVLATAPAHAQATRTWVSGVGDDVNPCSRTAPCKTFAGAISKTAAGGEINCLDPAGFGTLTITKSITIDCSGTFGSVLNSGVNGFNVNTDSVANMIVRVRGLSFNGVRTGPKGISITGATATSGSSAVSIEDAVIDGTTQFGIADTRAFGGRLFVSNVTIRNGIGSGVGIAPSSGSTPVKATLSRVRVFDSLTGFGLGASQVQLEDSISTGNSGTGLQADSGALVSVHRTTISHNLTGIAVTGTGVVRAGDSDISFNTTGTTGTMQSFVNNRFTNNGALGTITPVVGGVTNPQGQQ